MTSAQAIILAAIIAVVGQIILYILSPRKDQKQNESIQKRKKDKRQRESIQNSLEEQMLKMSIPKPKEDQKRKKGRIRLLLKGSGILFVFAFVVVIIVLFIRQEFITISWPATLIQKHEEYVSGKLANFSPDTYSKLDIKLFVHPGDGSDRYWLNLSGRTNINKDGVWYQNCRFGNENQPNLPLKFDVYAVVMHQGKELPLGPGNNYLSAASEEAFLGALQPYVNVVSNRFIVTRVIPTAALAPEIILRVTPPIKFTWSERVPRQIEFWHNDTRIINGEFTSDQHHDLSPSSIKYEIKMRRPGEVQESSLLILVEEAPEQN